jgi:hypothetical protein
MVLQAGRVTESPKALALLDLEDGKTLSQLLRSVGGPKVVLRLARSTASPQARLLAVADILKVRIFPLSTCPRRPQHIHPPWIAFRRASRRILALNRRA